jgi:hypothetical protein
MGTRSDIIVLCKDGVWRRIYCHWDGYVRHNGKILFENYNSTKKAEKLIGLGNLSILGPKCTKPKGHSWENKVDGYCVAYFRDRGNEPWEDVKAFEAETLEYIWPMPDCWTEYAYVWDGKEWKVGYSQKGVDTLESLKEAIDNL